MKERTSSARFRNDFGGMDHRGPAGTARSAVDDGERSVFSFDRSMTLLWSAAFSLAAPKALFDAAWYRAVQEADGAASDPCSDPVFEDAAFGAACDLCGRTRAAHGLGLEAPGAPGQVTVEA